MFRNCNNCCAQRYLNGVFVQPLLQITNLTPVDIYFVLQYTSKMRTKSKHSRILHREETERMRYPEGSTNIAFNVLKNNPPDYNLICNHVLGEQGRYYFKVVETPTGMACVQDHYFTPY